MRWTFRATICIAVLGALPACSQGPIDRDECVSKYAQRGSTEKIVRWGYGLCTIAADPNRTPREREHAICAIKMIPNTPTEIGIQAVWADCQKVGS